jgi:hypothetical protein
MEGEVRDAKLETLRLFGMLDVALLERAYTLGEGLE